MMAPGMGLFGSLGSGLIRSLKGVTRTDPKMAFVLEQFLTHAYALRFRSQHEAPSMPIGESDEWPDWILFENVPDALPEVGAN